MAAKKKHHRLGCERLETRDLMAGNVTVSVVANEVIVRGDNQSNQIEIFQLDNGAYRVRGLQGTTVNGVSFVDRTSIDRDLRVFMNGGKDTALIGNNFARPAMVVEDLEVDMGTGSDTLGIANLRATDNQDTVIRMGSSSDSSLDNDLVAIEKVSIKTGLRIETGSGADTVDIRTTRVTGKVSVDLGSGTDSLNLIDTIFASSDFNGGSGNDKYTRTRGSAGALRNFESSKVT